MALLEPSAAEQILFNLVDNACKYVSDASDKRIRLSGQRRRRRIAVVVRDHGPGVVRQHARLLFEPFSGAVSCGFQTLYGVHDDAPAATTTGVVVRTTPSSAPLA